MLLKGRECFPGEERKNTNAKNRHYSAANAVLDKLNDGVRFAARELMEDGTQHIKRIK